MAIIESVKASLRDSGSLKEAFTDRSLGTNRSPASARRVSSV